MKTIKKEGRVSTTLVKMIVMIVMLVIISGVYVLANNLQINNVTIKLSDNYEMNIVTSKSKVSEILEENHIVVLPDEKVVPELEEEIGENKSIIISKISDQAKVIELAETSEIITTEDVLKSYDNIIEKIIVEKVTIPYETITKDTSKGAKDTTNRVLRAGKEGLKEVTYKVKYQNNIEIERIEISSKVITEPINKIVQVNVKTTTRSDIRTATTNPATSSSTTLAKKTAGITPKVVTMNTSAYTASTCGKAKGSAGYGRTASGSKAQSWYTIAAGKSYKMGTVVYIPYFKNKPNGGWFVVQDRGGAISNNRIDVYMGTYNECINFGRRNLECYVYEF